MSLKSGVLFVMILLVSGCGNSEQEDRLQRFYDRVRANVEDCKPLQLFDVTLPKLNEGQYFIVINAGYNGYLKSGKYNFSQDLVRQINKYGAQEVEGTFLLITNKEHILAKLLVSSNNLRTDNKPDLANNAKVASFDSNMAIISCAMREETFNVSSNNIWNKTCVATVTRFE